MIGYTFLNRDYWGGKYNLEMKKLMLNHAFQFVNEVQFEIDARNVRSQKGTAKIGAVQVGSYEKTQAGQAPRTVLIYGLSRTAWTGKS
jgi:RimJ/RimL family protein N-acetyltransferase